MTAFVLDCSATMSWCFEDEMDRYSRGVLDALGDATAATPRLWTLEVANALVIAERRNRISQAETFRFFEFLESLPIVLRDHSTQQVWKEVLPMGRRYGLTAYDALYLFVSISENLPLATKDSALRHAANQSGVGLFDPG